MPPEYDQPYDIRAFIPPLRRCHHCGESQDNDPTIQLRKCGGCSKILYCSKTCQKEAWPTHTAVSLHALRSPLTVPYTYICYRLLCLHALPVVPVTSSGTSFFGYHSLPALAAALQKFREAHEWSFGALAKILVLTKGGIAWSQNPQKILTIEVAPVKTTGTREHNPSRAFRIESYHFLALDEYFTSEPRAIDEWAKCEPLRNTAIETYGHYPYYAGLLPLNLRIDGLNVTFMEYIPQFWPIPPSRPTPLLANSRTKGGLVRDILGLSYYGINAGIPLRTMGPDPPGMGLAFPGRFVRGQSASWSWTGLFSNWGDYRRGAHRRLDDLLDMIHLRGSHAEIMVAFDSI